MISIAWSGRRGELLAWTEEPGGQPCRSPHITPPAEYLHDHRHYPSNPLHLGVPVRRIPQPPRPHQCPVDREPPVVSRADTATPAPQITGPAAGQARSLCVTGVALPFLCGMKPHFVSHNRHPVYKWVYCIGVLTYATGLAVPEHSQPVPLGDGEQA